jgi:hypothetical protein
MAPFCLDHTFTQYRALHWHTTLIDHFHAMPSNSKHLAINMEGYYPFHNESPKEYSFTNEDLGLSTNKSDFDTYDFYYNEELNTPPKMDNDTTISNLQSPTLPRWGSFL